MKIPIKLAETWSDIKSNYAFYGITLLVLGAISQFISLVRIDTSYLRFFSVTQQISDGLLFGFYGFIIFLCYLIGETFVKANRRENDVIVENDQRTRNLLLLSIISIPIIMFALYNYNIVLSYLFNEKKTITEGSGHLSLFIFYCLSATFFISIGRLWFDNLLLYLQFVFDIKNRIKSYLSSSKEDDFQLIPILSFYFALVLLIIVITNAITIVSNFHESRLVPDNLKRKIILIENYSKTYKTPKDSIKIIYYNDKYIFLSISNKSDSIDILPFESFLSGK